VEDRVATELCVLGPLEVVRDGVTVHSSLMADLTTDQLIHHMVGREVSAIYSRDPGQRGHTVRDGRDTTMLTQSARRIGSELAPQRAFAMSICPGTVNNYH
jgi:ABC-type sugar transport system ATPase subunit